MIAPLWSESPGLSASVLAMALGLPEPTDEQRAVIESGPSPALVVAGAGSGKTETMAARVVWLVANGHVARDEVLGLTFTRKAATELAERIGRRLATVEEYADRGLLVHLPAIVADERMARFWETHRNDAPRDRSRALAAFLDTLVRETGAEPPEVVPADRLLQRPRVSTYNAFADAIVREHGARIGRDPDAALLSQSAAWLLARRAVIESGDDRLAERDEAFSTVVDAVHSLAGEVLDHRVDLDEMAEFGRRWSARLEGVECRLERDRRAVASAQRALGGLPVLADLVRDYARRKALDDTLDFADQVAGALEIVTGSPEVAQTLREQYRVVLLDEYQDTSVIQTQLLAAIFRDTPVMAVGDPHQSIYAWRGASADNLTSFPRAFAHDLECTQHGLMVSWRNDRAILDAANALVVGAGPAAAEVGTLRARPGAGAGRVEHRFTATVEDEADETARWFARIRAERVEAERLRAQERLAEGSGPSPQRPHSGAILFRTKRHMNLFAEALARHGVPHRILGLGGLLSTPEVVDTIAVLRVIHDPSQGSSLIRLLAGPRFAIGVADLGALHGLAQLLARRDASLAPVSDAMAARLRASAGVDEQPSIIEALEFVRTAPTGHGLLSSFSPEGLERLRDAGATVDRLRRAAGQPIPELLRLIEAELRLDIELAANESRGPARLATVQLRAFADEVRGFLLADERGSLGSLLAWLDHAEDTDELMPRAEPPEAGVVQLVTIHGAKGLEWDAVAVVRWVEKELPKAPRNLTGWLGFGVLPYPLRGDRDALPRFDEAVADEDLPAEIEQFRERSRAHQEAEERRLAYVALTRAREDLLVTGSHWGGQRDPRSPSRYFVEALGALGVEIDPGEPGDDPALDRGGRVLSWPLDPLGGRRRAVEEAAELVRAVPENDPPVADEVLARLLDERRRRAEVEPSAAPLRLPASRFKDYVSDYRGAVAAIARPMPERPYRQTRIGTLFHAWVEQRAGVASSGPSRDAALWEQDDASATEASEGASESLATLQAAFERSEWALLAPLEVEAEIDFTLRLPGGESHVVVCKLDAVYRRHDRDGRIEIVDWKTGAAPRTAKEKDERMLQLALYRLAYHRAHGVPLDEIDVALFYVASETVVRSDRVYSEEELAQRWIAARDAR